MLVGIAAVLTVALEVERLYGNGQAKSAPFNAACGLCQLVLTQVFNAAIAPTVLWASALLGEPLIHLSGRGWMFPVSVFVVLALVDLVDYFFHRLEHEASVAVGDASQLRPLRFGDERYNRMASLLA